MIQIVLNFNRNSKQGKLSQGLPTIQFSTLAQVMLYRFYFLARK